MDPASVFNQIREILCFRVHLEGTLSRRHGSSAFVGYSVLASMDLVHLEGILSPPASKMWCFVIKIFEMYDPTKK